MSIPNSTSPVFTATGARAQYDAVAPHAKKKRREARIETAGETGSRSQQLPPMSRLTMIALVRDAARNYSSSRAMLKQLGLNVVGTEYKLRIRIPHDRKNLKDPVTAGENWFNRVWARTCDFRGDLHLFDVNRLLVTSVARDGDAGMLFDRDFQQTGRLVTWESDQICDPSPLPPGVKDSNDGVLVDAMGREIGYFAHNGYGKSKVPLTEGHVFPRDPVNEDNNMFRLLRVPWRLNQYRGTSDLFSVVADLLDVYEMRAKELQSAKVAASLGGVITEQDQVSGPAVSDPRLDPNQYKTDADAAAATVTTTTSGDPLYDRLEALTGGYTQYLRKGDKFELVDPKRPNINAIGFIDAIVKSAGSAFGMARCYSTMEAQASYTAFRGEMVMTWVMFNYWQKWLERYAQDWQAVRALRFGMDTGRIPKLPDGWEGALAWTHPKMPSVNPLVDQQTFLAALRNGTSSLAQELGPAWSETIDELAVEIAAFQARKIPHPILQTVAGAAAPTGETAPANPTEDTKED
jgi:capsid protein